MKTDKLPNELLKQFKNTKLARGLRNNNPLNIRVNAFLYRGQVPLHLKTDLLFKQFYKIEDGFYNGYRLLVNSYINNGYNTIEKILKRFAPVTDNNNTSVYISDVSKQLGVQSSDVIKPNDKQLMASLLAAMAYKETGKKFTSNEVIKYI